MSIITQVETITPVLAQQYLAQNIDNNRHLNEHIVSVYARQMQCGEWKLNGDPIRFDSTNRLIDGQHRLSAIVRAKTPMKCVVVRGVSPDAIESIDIGRKRNVSDILRMQHGVKQNAGPKASIAKALYTPYEHGAPFHVHTPKGTLTTHKIVETYLQHQEAIDFVAHGRKDATPPIAVIGSVIVRAYYHENHQKLERFLTILATGNTNGEHESAAIRLRDYLVDLKLKGIFGRGIQWKNFEVTQSTLKAFLQGRKMTRRIALFKDTAETQKVLLHSRQEINWKIHEIDEPYLNLWEQKKK